MAHNSRESLVGRAAILWVNHFSQESAPPLAWLGYPSTVPHRVASLVWTTRDLPTELPASPSQQHLISINTDVSPDTHVEQITDGRSQAAQMRPEDIIIVPAQVMPSARWNRAHSYLASSLEPIALAQKISDLLPGYAVELLPQFVLYDRL